MKNNLVFKFALPAILLLLSACNKEPEAILVINGPKAFSCGSEGATNTVSFTTTYPWNVSSSASWISLSSKAGEAGDNHLDYIIAESDSPEGREGFIYFTSHSLCDTVKVLQGQKDKISVEGQKTYSFGSEGGELDIDVYANIDFSVISEAEWIIRKETKAYVANAVSFDILPNTEYEDREAYIIFENASITDSILVCQKQLDTLISSSENMLLLPKSSGYFTIKISTNVNYDISISSGSWLEYIETKALRDDSLEFAYKSNESGESRTAVITLSGPGKIKETYTVTQSAANMIQIGINDKSFISPLIKGSKISGDINWGDGTIEQYKSGILHNYSAKNARNVTIAVQGNTGVKIENLVGVESIDISNF